MALAFSRARENTGKRIAAKIAIMAMTTSSSMSVKPAAGVLAATRKALRVEDMNDTPRVGNLGEMWYNRGCQVWRLPHLPARRC